MKLPKKRKFKPGRVPIEEVEAFLFAGGKTLSDWRLCDGIPRSGSLDWMIDDDVLATAVVHYLREHGVVEVGETECAAD